MAQIGLITVASVPDETSVRVTVNEDVTGDGSVDNKQSQTIHDGRRKYALSGFDCSRGNRVWVELNLRTDDIEKTPAVKAVGLDVVTKQETGSGPHPTSLEEKLQESHFFYEQITESEDEMGIRYNLSAYLNATYSIHEVLDDNGEYSVDSWSDCEYEQDLLEYMREQRTDTVHVGRQTSGHRQPPVEERLGNLDESTNSKGDSPSELTDGLYFPRVRKSIWSQHSSEYDIERVYVDGEFKPVAEIERWRSVSAEKLARAHLQVITSWVEDWFAREGHPGPDISSSL